MWKKSLEGDGWAIFEGTIEEKTRRLIKEYAGDPHCVELLLFLARHPRAKFSRLAIFHALNGTTLYKEQALSRLTNSGVLRTYVENGVPLYSLAV